MYSYQFPKADVTSSVIAYSLESSGHPTVTTLGILGIIRGKEPFKGMTALPGGFLNPGQETLRQCGFRETFLEEIIAKGNDGPMSNQPLVAVYDRYSIERPTEAALRLVCEQSDPLRDPRFETSGAPVIDHVYSVQLPWEVYWHPKLSGGDDAVGLLRISYTRNDLPTREQIKRQWAFDHGDSICHFLTRLGWLEEEPTTTFCPACKGTGKT